jgi:hypothetical protein
VFLGIIFFLELTAGVLAFVFKDWIKDQLYFFINNNIRAYRDDIDLQNLIDFTQEYVSSKQEHLFSHNALCAFASWRRPTDVSAQFLAVCLLVCFLFHVPPLLFHLKETCSEFTCSNLC